MNFQYFGTKQFFMFKTSLLLHNFFMYEYKIKSFRVVDYVLKIDVPLNGTGISIGLT